MTHAFAGSVALCLLVPVLAHAQPTTADGWYAEGETRYDLGEFEKAADAFKEGFKLEADPSKKATFLYNIAQAYRFANKCREASFFYKRFLLTAPSVAPATRSDVDKRVTELEDCVQKQDAIASKPPKDTMAPTEAPPARAPVQTAATEDEDAEVEDVVTAEPVRPRFVIARVGGGLARSTFGGTAVTSPVVAASAAFPLQLRDDLRLEVGATGTYVPIAFETSRGRRTASLASALATVAAGYDAVARLTVRGELGAGISAIGGLVDENPFTAEGSSATGALAMFATRAAVSADYAITPAVIATVTPFAVTWSPGRSDFRDDITSVVRIEAFVGIGYRH